MRVRETVKNMILMVVPLTLFVSASTIFPKNARKPLHMG